MMNCITCSEKQLTDKLKEDLPEMLEEHQRIVKALQNLIEHASAEHHPEVDCI